MTALHAEEAQVVQALYQIANSLLARRVRFNSLQGPFDPWSYSGRDFASRLARILHALVPPSRNHVPAGGTEKVTIGLAATKAAGERDSKEMNAPAAGEVFTRAVDHMPPLMQDRHDAEPPAEDHGVAFWDEATPRRVGVGRHRKDQARRRHAEGGGQVGVKPAELVSPFRDSSAPRPPTGEHTCAAKDVGRDGHRGNQ